MAPCGPDLYPGRALESRIRYQDYRERERLDERETTNLSGVQGAFQRRVSCLHFSKVESGTPRVRRVRLPRYGENTEKETEG